MAWLALTLTVSACGVQGSVAQGGEDSVVAAPGAASGTAAAGPTAPSSDAARASGRTTEAPAATIDGGVASSAPGAGASSAAGRTPPSPTKPVPVPGGGTISDVVEVRQQRVLDAVDWSDPVVVDDRATVDLLEVVRTKATARAPGEIGGPAMKVVVRLRSESGDPIDLGGVTITAEDDDQTPLTQLGTDPADPFFGELAAGSSAEATYLFSLPKGSATPVTITVNYAADAPVAVFEDALS